MINFPQPYPEELIYSVMARARVHHFVLSPKALIASALESRTAIATQDLPARLARLSANYNHPHLDANYLIDHHTLFPLYGPFIPPLRKLLCRDWMRGQSNGGPHLASGYVASRLPKRKLMKYCPICAKEQYETLGEPYWQRQHQVIGLTVCTEHHVALRTASYCWPQYHRHEYFPASACRLSFEGEHQSCSYHEIELAKQIKLLLSSAPLPSPSYEQWTAFYRELMRSSSCNKGQYVQFSALLERVEAYWPMQWLQSVNLWPLDSPSSWLHGISRKHRKSFSYLEHIVLLQSLKSSPWDIGDVLAEASSMECNSRTSVVQSLSSREESRRFKIRWLTLVKIHGTKLARTLGGGSIYAWLYRHQRQWLLKINSRSARPICNKTNRVDWPKRDKATVRQLIRTIAQLDNDLLLPRMSANWLLHQLDSCSSVEKNLNKLPLTNAFLERYSEAVWEYQIRRITRVLLDSTPGYLASWKLLRAAGLSDERLTAQAREFLQSFGLAH